MRLIDCLGESRCGRTARTVREGGTGEVDAQASWITCTRRETAGTEPIRRTGHTEPVPYFTRYGPQKYAAFFT